jgi:hypothetical protein
LITSLSSKGAVSALGLQGGNLLVPYNGGALLILGHIIMNTIEISIADNNSLFLTRKN